MRESISGHGILGSGAVSRLQRHARGGYPGLRLRWPAVWRRLGASIIPDANDLLDRWAEPQRAYHSTAHLAHCLAIYDRNPLRDARVEMAIWFHDAVYDPRAGDNEERSAALFRDMACTVGLPQAGITAIVDCILATRHRDPPADLAQALTLDIDLAILGETKSRFDRYEVAIRVEYAWVPGETYRRERGRILARFAARRDLFTTPWFRRHCMTRARANLRRAVRRLEADHG